MPGKNLKLADDFAADYDASVLQNNWIGPKVIFDLVKPHLNKPSSTLDLGIGTGESASPFALAGHKITGLDGSEKMLEQCRQKKIGDELVLHNLEVVPFPLTSNNFDAVISNGVFHLIHPITPLFSEVQRILKPNGIFAFSYEAFDHIEGSTQVEPGVWEKETETGVLTYTHEKTYIRKLLRDNQFEVIDQSQFLAFVNKKSNTKFYFEAVMARLKPNR
ncbi:class I SAM-dependent DNA methyltransferase [Maribellus mangrovi]|uniref:class I SAM-dependent DNA methyltransferase n=1 Tax=Maribellus mangrovi TaxID=3133146 RepID=UPI0030EF1E54